MEQYLVHYGTKGQKWGIRNYENLDGTLTEEGKKRYAKYQGKIERKNRQIEKAQTKLDKLNKKNAEKIARLKSKSAKYRNKAYNGRFVNDKKAAELEVKARKADAKADKLQAKANTQQAKIDKAKAYVHNYEKKLNQISPNSVEKGKSLVDSYIEKNDRK